MSQRLRLLMLKDFRCLWRSPEILVAVFGFALLLIVVASFSFRQIGFGNEQLTAITPGILWLVFLFCGSMCLNHSFELEERDGALRGLISSIDSVELIFLSKFLTNFLFLFVLELFALVVHSILFNIEVIPVLEDFLIILALFAFGFSAIGTLFSAMSVTSKSREILLPILLFPLCLPLVSACVVVSRELLLSGQIEYSGFWFVLVAVFDVVSFVLAWVLFEFVVR